MGRERAVKTKYNVYYGTDRNAALKPQYVPQPEERVKKRTVSKAKEAKAERAAAVAKCTVLVMLVMCVAAMGFLVVTRNAAIYSNNRTIRSLANEKADLEIMLNTAEKDGSWGGDLNTYLETAENELQLSYPDADKVVTVVLPAQTEAVQEAATEESVNVYDAVLDWFSSLQRRIESWA
ncbi:MAG: hypothetical protein IKM06_03430 [Clostridia bacterium]|nr:hypothetical protein [Clostridia bacterium]